MKDSGVEWLPKVPDDWRVIPFKHLFKEMDRPVQESDEIITCFRDGEVTLRKNRREDGFTMADQEIGYQHISVGDLVVHGMDGFAGSIGISDSDGKATPVLIVMNPLHDECSRYFMYLLRVYAQLEVFLATSSGIRVRSCALNWKKLGSLPAFVPSAEEQRRIVRYLDERCAAIDEVKRTIEDEIEALRRLRKATIHRAVTKGLNESVPMRDSGVEWIGEVPEHWTIVHIRHLFKENVRSSSEDDIPLSLSQADGLIATDEMKERSLKTSSYDGWKRVEVDDLVINRFKAHLGVMFAATLEGKVSFHYGVYEKRRPLVTKYYEYLFHTSTYCTVFAGASNGMVVGLQNLSNQNFYSVYSLFPPIEEQREIVDYLDERCAAIDSVIDTRTRQVERLDDYRRALIFAYVTGKKEAPSHE